MPDVNLENNTFKCPNKLVNRIKSSLDNFNGPETTEGYVRAKNIVDDPIISLALLKKINNFFRSNDENHPGYELTGGDFGKNTFAEMERQAREGEDRSRKTKMRGGFENTHKKPHERDDNANATAVHVPKVDKANRLRESIDEIKRLINI
tara:strand:- start:9902 stop:10351 length:450 start_codon:yes stop_codon:yes gene_type:complete